MLRRANKPGQSPINWETALKAPAVATWAMVHPKAGSKSQRVLRTRTNTINYSCVDEISGEQTNNEIYRDTSLYTLNLNKTLIDDEEIREVMVDKRKKRRKGGKVTLAESSVQINPEPLGVSVETPRVLSGTPERADAIDEARDSTTNTVPEAVGNTSPPNMKLVFFNVSVLNRQKMEELILRINQEEIDIIFVIDTNIKETEIKELTKIALRKLGPGTQTYYTTSSDESRVGGQMIIATPKFGCAIHNFWTDRTSLGLVASLTMQLGETSLMILGTYWPCLPPKQGEAGQFKLHNITKAYMDSNKERGSPLDFIKEIIENRKDKHLSKPNAAFIMGGDLNGGNGSKEGSNGDTLPWTNRIGLSHATRITLKGNECTEEEKKTFHRNGTGISRIDHIFVARETDSNTPYLARGIVVRSYATLRKTEWVILSDHRPVQVELDILGMGMQRSSRQERNREDKVSAQVNVDLNNKEK